MASYDYLQKRVNYGFRKGVAKTSSKEERKRGDSDFSIFASKNDTLTSFTECLARADATRKLGNYRRSLLLLQQAYMFRKGYNVLSGKEYLLAISKRVKRAAEAAVAHKKYEIAHECIRFGKDLEGQIVFTRDDPDMDSTGRKIRGIVSIFSLLAGMFFLSANLTGNVIGNLTNSTSNIIGSVLLIGGIVGAFFWLKK